MKKVVFSVFGLGLVVSLAFAQMMNFTGSTAYQDGMTLEQAEALASVSAEDAVQLAQDHAGLIYEDAEADLSVVDGFLIWAVDLGSKTVFVDIADASLISSQDVLVEAYAGEGEAYEDEDDDYEDDEDEDYEDDEEEYEDEDEEEYEDEDDD